MMRRICRAFLVFDAALGARAESTTSTPFHGAEELWARASRQLFLGATSCPPPSLCTDTCVFASEDDGQGDDCNDDGTFGSEFPMCASCADCVDCGPRVPRAPPPPPAGTPFGTSSPDDDDEYPNGQLGTDCADYGPGQSLPPPEASPVPLRVGTDICTKTCSYDGGPGSEFPMCTDCDGRPPPPPHSPGMVCTNNRLNVGGNLRSDGIGPRSEFATCVFGTDCVDCDVSMPSPPPRPPAAHPAPNPPPSICSNPCLSSNADCDDGGPGSKSLSCAASAVVSINRNVRAVMSIPRAVVSIVRAVMHTTRVPLAPPSSATLCMETCIYASDADCGMRQPLPTPTASSPPSKGICLERCFYANRDNGGPSSEITMCAYAYGTNCVGCGPRLPLPPSPPRAPPGPPSPRSPPGPPLPPRAPPATPSPPSLCSAACLGMHAYGSNCDDGGPCDDGGASTEFSDCQYGIDCVDCCPRAQPPPQQLYNTLELRSGSTVKRVRSTVEEAAHVVGDSSGVPWDAVEWLNFGNVLLRLGSLVFAVCWRQHRSNRNQCLALAFFMHCVPRVSANDLTRHDGDGTGAQHETASVAPLMPRPPPLPPHPPPHPPPPPFIRLCTDELNSGAFYLSGAPLPCNYFSAQPSACASHSIARTTCPVACDTCSPLLQRLSHTQPPPSPPSPPTLMPPPFSSLYPLKHAWTPPSSQPPSPPLSLLSLTTPPSPVWVPSPPPPWSPLMALPCTVPPCTEARDVPGLYRGLQLAVPSQRRELQTQVSTSAGITSALANTAVGRIVLAPGTYNLAAELSITRSVILEAAAGATVTLNAQASSSSWRRVLNINPGSSGVVQLIGLGITGGYGNRVRSHVQKLPWPR
jgi:hypothetical protein